MKEKGITQYDLYSKYNMNRSQLHRLRKNENVTVLTLDRLCNILSCELDDIAEHIPDDNDHFQTAPGGQFFVFLHTFPEQETFFERKRAPTFSVDAPG